MAVDMTRKTSITLHVTADYRWMSDHHSEAFSAVVLVGAEMTRCCLPQRLPPELQKLPSSQALDFL